ncbi:uncharacterized protein LMH87_008951 [Akanthomyces muscarius]|uniref:Hydrophobin n=1 Tax=Akanthomyces muscarius TaxID=2231603 RepID=A0A9W8QK85_AKAMU|nr:uncharacterized protein LMH87_008951 [Akanthomyces muscarius]KAJ4158425.1 hypothetical protein LMH87_008951 [Akanthomyces muscarius]
MQFSIVALFIGAAIATPVALSGELATRGDGPCGTLLYGNPHCCSSDVLGLLDLSCSTPSSANDMADLKKSCGDEGLQARCCTINLAGLGVICKAA